MLGELVSSEQVYVAALQKVHDFYAEPLRSSAAGAGLLSEPGDWEAVFLEFETILKTQCNFEKKLTQQWQHFASSSAELGTATVMPVVNLLKEFATTGLPAYEAYVLDYQTMRAKIDALKKATAKNAAGRTFIEFLRAQQQLEGCKADLEFLSIQPVQRLPRYSLLLRELVKCTPPQMQEEHAELTEVHGLLTKVCAQINSAAAMKEKWAQLLALHNRFSTSEGEITSQCAGPLAYQYNLKDAKDTIDGLVKSYREIVQIFNLERANADFGPSLDWTTSNYGIVVIVFNDKLLLAKNLGDETDCLLRYLGHIELIDTGRAFEITKS